MSGSVGWWVVPLTWVCLAGLCWALTCPCLLAGRLAEPALPWSLVWCLGSMGWGTQALCVLLPGQGIRVCFTRWAQASKCSKADEPRSEHFPSPCCVHSVIDPAAKVNRMEKPRVRVGGLPEGQHTGRMGVRATSANSLLQGLIKAEKATEPPRDRSRKTMK